MFEVDENGTPEGVVEAKDASSDIAVNVTETDDPWTFTLLGGVTNLVDRVNDVVLPGAYTKTLKARTPKIIKDHEWSQRLGKVLEIKELHPGDPELPKETADGSPWPKDAGALRAKVRLFKKSQAGQEAAERWREYGRDQQFSIGYRVPAGMAVKGKKDGVRYIKELDLYEISDVLWGAAPDSTLLPSVLATKVLAGVELESKGGEPEDDDVDSEVAAVDVDSDVEESGSLVAEDTAETQPADGGESEDDADEVEEAPPVTHKPFDDDDADFDIEEVDFDSDDIDAEAFDAFGDEIASMVTSDVERGNTPETAAPSTADAGEHTADTVAGADPGPGIAPDNAAAVDATVDGTDGAREDASPEEAAPSTSEAGVLGRPDAEKTLGAIESHVHLRAALRTYETVTDGEKAALASYIVASAERAGISFLVPDDVTALVDSVKYDTSPTGTPGGKPNWIDQNGSLPPFFRALVHALQRSGHEGSRAYALAYGSIKRWAKGGGNVTEKTRAKAVDALAKMDALRAKAAAKRATKSIEPVDGDAPEGFEPVDTDVAESDTLEAPVDEEFATGSAERKSMTVPFFAGSNEERRSLVSAALMDSMELGQFEGRPQIIGTFDGYVIVTVWADDGADYATYKVDFDYDDTDGTVELGKVERIRITTKQTTGDDESDSSDAVDGILGGLDADSSDGADSVKHAVTMLDLEDKAGRVLSAANAEALKSAYEALGELLAKAGVDVETTDGEDVVTDESDVDEKTAELVETPIEETDEYKQLQLIRMQVAIRERAARLND